MPRYNFVCDPCEEHPDEMVCREVFMPIKHFSEDGKRQVCDKCGKLMRHVLEMPAVHYKGRGFYNTDYPKDMPQQEREERTDELEEHYYNKAIADGALDQARQDIETVRINRWRDTTTGKKYDIPVEET